MSNEAQPIKLPGLKRVWRVRIADNVDKPQFQTSVLVRSETAFSSIADTKKTETFEKFQEIYAECDVVETLFMGPLEK